MQIFDRIPRSAGTWLLLAGACLGTCGLPLLFHGHRLVTGHDVGLSATIALLATAFAVLAAGFYAVTPPATRKTGRAMGLAAAATVVCAVMGVLLAIAIGIIFACVGVAGYHFSAV